MDISERNALSALAAVCWSGGVYQIPNSKHQITNKSQIFTLWNPPEEGRQEAAFHRAGIQ
jgi:hypothetical protein